GSFALPLVDLGHRRQPDLVYVLRSGNEADPYGNPGLGLITKSDVPVGGGMHGGLNRYELNAVLVVKGRGSEPGRTETGPSGIIDIAPTVLGLLGLGPAASMVGHSLAS